VWIDDMTRDAERWASTSGIQREARSLAAAAERGMSPAQLCATPARHALMDLIAPFSVIEELVAFNLTLRDGTIIASRHEAYCGHRLNGGDFMERIAPVFQGRTVFVRPYSERDRVPDLADPPVGRALVWIETPVRDERGEVIAALGFGRFADERFGKLLSLSGAQTSREAYAFDRQGMMLTRSRYLEDLRRAGVVGPGDGGILQLQLRDPGGDVIAGFRPQAPPAEWPLTRLVSEALAAPAKPGSETIQGAVLEPYRNYRGAEVVGAWRWIPEKEMAIAVEIETQEAFAPLRYLQIAFGGLFALMLLSLVATAAASLWAMRLRMREARRIGQYTLEREIGEGGMSRVYLARHSHLKRPTAVKVLKMALATDEVVARFQREVQLCSQLTHPNTIEIYDYGHARDGGFYYAMEYLRGISLEDLVRRKGALPVARAVHCLLQVCGSLREAHGRGLVHRDIKPHNLMLCVRGGQYDVVKVVDFGLVKEMRNPHTRDITQYAKVLGTPLYMTPERLRDPADADARTDIYALGAVAFFLLTGRPLFEAATDHDLVYQILNRPAPTLAEGGMRDPPHLLEALLARCLSKNRDERPASIDEVASVLAEVARQFPWPEEDARLWWTAHAAELGVPLDA
jgi:serine/threonine-protein kinase